MGIGHFEAPYGGANALQALPMTPLADARKACFALAPAKVLVSDKASECASKPVDITRRRRETIHALLDQIRDAANLARDNNGKLSTHRLIDRQSPRLVLGGQYEDIGCGVEARQFRLIDEPGKHYIRELMLPTKAPQLVLKLPRSRHDYGKRGTLIRGQLSGGFKEVARTFAPRKLCGIEHGRPINRDLVPETYMPAFIFSEGSRLYKPVIVDRIGNKEDLLGGNAHGSIEGRVL